MGGETPKVRRVKLERRYEAYVNLNKRCGAEGALWGSGGSSGPFPTLIVCARPPGHDGKHGGIPHRSLLHPTRWWAYCWD